MKYFVNFLFLKRDPYHYFTAMHACYNVRIIINIYLELPAYIQARFPIFLQIIHIFFCETRVFKCTRSSLSITILGALFFDNARENTSTIRMYYLCKKNCELVSSKEYRHNREENKKKLQRIRMRMKSKRIHQLAKTTFHCFEECVKLNY